MGAISTAARSLDLFDAFFGFVIFSSAVLGASVLAVLLVVDAGLLLFVS